VLVVLVFFFFFLLPSSFFGDEEGIIFFLLFNLSFQKKHSVITCSSRLISSHLICPLSLLLLQIMNDGFIDPSPHCLVANMIRIAMIGSSLEMTCTWIEPIPV
jgi:hypothetical protein